MNGGTILWVGLGVLVLTYSLGGWLVSAVTPLVAGVLLTVGYLSWHESHHARPPDRQDATEVFSGYVQEVVQVVRRRNMDRRLTGSIIIDEQLQRLVTYCLRDYVETWYYQHISSNPLFLEAVRESASSVLINFSMRSKTVEWLPFFTQRVLDDLVSHLRIFRKALKICQEEHKDPMKQKSAMEETFFKEEAKAEKQPHLRAICSDIEEEKAYLRIIAEMLLYFLLPEMDFQNKSLRFILREILVEQVILPLANLLSDPDYLNATIAMLTRESSLNPDSFIAALHTCDVPFELSTIAGCVLQEKERTKQRGSSEEHLEQLSSLNYVAKLCQECSGNISEQPPDEMEQTIGNASLPVVGLRSILTNNSALSYFIDFLGGDPVKQAYISFWLEAESFQLIVSRLADKSTDYSSDEFEVILKKYAANAQSIFDNHFADEAEPRLSLSYEISERTLEAINFTPLLPDCLAIAQEEVFKVLEGPHYYEAFLKSSTYKKCLSNLGLLSDMSHVVDVEQSTSSVEASKPYKLVACVPGHVEKMEGAKSYTCYRIEVTCQHHMGPEELYIIERRYSDFHNFHLALKAKLGQKNLPPDLVLPVPWSLNKHDPALKEFRKKGLNVYLKALLSDEKLTKNIQVYGMIVTFLSESYTREKRDLTRKVDSILRLKGDISKKLLPGSSNSPGILRKFLNFPATTEADENSTLTLLSAGLDEDEENIPLQVMLRLMDEVFELRMKSQGLRRHVTRVLRQFIQKTFGDRINRRIVQFIDWITSSKQLAQHIGTLCDAMWPGGCPSPTADERSEATKHITKVIARAKLLGSMPDDLRRFIGTKNTQDGITQVFELFQYTKLNKRIFYLLFEGLLEAIFSHNQVSEILSELHQ